MNLQPIDGAYFVTVYFWISTVVALVVSFVGVMIMEGK